MHARVYASRMHHDSPCSGVVAFKTGDFQRNRTTANELEHTIQRAVGGQGEEGAEGATRIEIYAGLVNPLSESRDAVRG